MIKWFLSSSFLILVIILLRYLCRGKISLRFQYALWLIVAVRLLVPVNIGTSFLSIENVTEKIKAQSQIQNVIQLSEQTIPIVSYESAYKEVIQKYEDEGRFSEGVDAEELEAMEQEAYALVEETSIAELIESIAFLVWKTGVLVFIIVFLVTNLVFGRKVKKTRCEIKIPYTKLPVYVSDKIETPCLSGMLSPSIYVTAAVAENPTLLRHSIFHEMTHYEHGDLYWSVVRCICLTLHWYNPFVWWAAVLSKQDAELACDEGTIQRLGEKERVEYGKTLIQLTCEKRQELFIAATTMTSGKNKIKERICLIAKKPKVKWYAIVFLLTAGAVTVGCTFTDKKGDVLLYNEGDYNGREIENDTVDLETIIATEEEEIPFQKNFYREIEENKVCLAVMPNGVSKAGGDYRFIIPEDQTYWVSEYKEMKSYASEERGWRKGEQSQGVWIVFNEEWTEITDQGFIIGLERRVEKSEDEEFYYLCVEEAMKYGTGTPLRPTSIENIVSATLIYDDTYTVTDKEVLEKLEKSFSESTELRGGGACPFTAPLTLELENGEAHTIYLATDSCTVWLNDGVYYTYLGFEDIEDLKDLMQDAAGTESDVPSKKEVLAMREQVLEGMTEEEITRLKENIKTANLRMEHGYLNEDLFGKLEDKNHLYWNYFDATGKIQIGWAVDGELAERKEEICKKENLTEEAFYEKYGEPVMDSNRFDGENFIELLEEMKKSIQNEKLRQDIQYMIDETELAVETHEMEHANNIYKVLHDMDYFLLRYGIEDVGVYTQDDSIVSKYYGVLRVYED